MALYGNTFDGYVWVTPFPVKCRYPKRPRGDFGPREPFDTVGDMQSSSEHKGLDLNPEESTDKDIDVIATRSGKVTSVAFDKYSGYYVTVDHEGGYRSQYFHLKQNSTVVKVGDSVAQGQKLAIRGTTGSSTGLHLHFGIIKTDKVIPRELADLDTGDPDRPMTITANGRLYLNPEPILFGSLDEKNRKDGFVTGSARETLLTTDRGKVWLYFEGKKFNSCAIAGIMGNIDCESNFKPNNVQNSFNSDNNITDEKYTEEVDNGTYLFGPYTDTRTSFSKDEAGYGLIQWTYYTLKESLYDAAKSRGVSIADLNLQLDEIWNVMDTELYYARDIYPEGYTSDTWQHKSSLINELKSDEFETLSGHSPNIAIKYATALFLFEVERCQDYESKIDLRYEHSKIIYDTFNDVACKHLQIRVKGTVVPTCTEKGYTGDTFCIDCGTMTEKGSDLDANGHEWDWSDGGKVCRVCSYVERYPISGATTDTPKLKRIHNVLRDILVRKN